MLETTLHPVSKPVIRLLAAVAWSVVVSSLAAAPTDPREVVSFDRGWQFHLGEAQDAENPAYDDASWRTLDVPHDWMIAGVPGKDPSGMEGPFDKNSPAGKGGGYLTGGIGWYRKTFTLPESSRAKRVGLLFDGAYMDSQVWLNGKLVGARPYGYSSFYVDLSADAHFGDEKNVLAVRLNVEQPCSRWYSGAGINRNVWLMTTDPVHVPLWGTFVTTPRAAATDATVRVQTPVRNDGASPAEVVLTTFLFDPDGKEVGSQQSTQRLAARSDASFDQTLSLPTARLWSTGTPVLYRAVNEIRVGGTLADAVTTPFGIRTLEFKKDQGFFLNGQRVEIRGVCDHHDLGCLGAVALRRGYERQLQILKGMGCNALRTSHNPPAPELLDACDRMGILVMDEAFDEWLRGKTKMGYARFFEQWSDTDIKTMMDRDRNHPSIILWSIGNEISEGLQNTVGTARALAERLVADCHREDPTRLVTSACPHPAQAWLTGLAPALDVFGINYSSGFYKQNDPAGPPANPPAKPEDYHGQLPMVASETASQTSSRGEYGLTLDGGGNLLVNTDVPFRTVEYGNFPTRGAFRAERSLLDVKQSPWVGGEFVWTGFDYLGEPSYDWPARSSDFGIVDLCGFPKDRFYLYKASWTTGPVVHLLPHWTWPGFDGKPIPVWVFTNADSVELFLNGRSLGAKNFPADAGDAPAAKDRPNRSLHLAWSVPYAPGTLRAVAKKNGQTVATDEVQTTGAPAAITLAADRPSIEASGQDLSFIKVSVVDKEGRVCPQADPEVSFTVNGAAAVLAGLDDGDPINHEAFQGTRHRVFHGLGLAVLQSRYDTPGPVTVTASAPGLSSASATVQVVTPGPDGR